MKTWINRTIDSLPKTSSITKNKLKKLGIFSYYDLLNYFPIRYIDYSKIIKLATVNKLINQTLFDQQINTVTIQGIITQLKNVYTRSHISLQKIILTDDSGSIELIWFNQPYLLTLLKKDQQLSVAGKIDPTQKLNTFYPQEYEILKLAGVSFIHTGRIIPIYSETRGLSSRTIREKISSILNDNFEINEILPQSIISDNNLIDIKSAYQQIHFPDNFEVLKKARQRLAFNELFIINLSSSLVN